jgi:hypothetical protein
MAIRKANTMYIPEDYYKLIAYYRKRNTFSVYQMKRAEVPPTKNPEDSISEMLMDSVGEAVKWMRFLRKLLTQSFMRHPWGLMRKYLFMGLKTLWILAAFSVS